MTSVPHILPRLHPTTSPRRRVGVAATSIVAISTFGLLAGLTGTAQAASTVPLAGAAVYGVLGTTVTNTGISTVAGDVGGSTRTGTGSLGADSIVHTSGIDRGDIGDGQYGLTAAISNARGRTSTRDVGTANLASSSPLDPGVYTSGSDLALTGPLVLDGAGSYDSVFIFRATAGLTTAAASVVTLRNGAQACNVFWEIGSSATLGAGSRFAGTVLATTSISVKAAASINGRLLAGSAVTLINDTITRSRCRTGSVVPVVVPPTTSAPAPATTAAAPTGTSSSATSATAGAGSSSSATPPGSATSRAASAPTSAGAGRVTTYGQVGRVPVGAVDTGDGSAAGRTR